jgi:holo-[acyl-carrier protein] synthase
MIFGTGIDIIEVKRIKDAVLKWGDDFLKRIFSKKELSYAKQRNFSVEHLAGRFAAKEAVMKAFSKSKYNFHEIEILNDLNGKPYCTLKKYGFKINISISHTKNYAVASAIIEKKA